MNKIALTLAALPTLAIGLMTASDSAEARMRFGIGFGFGNNWAHQQVFQPRWKSERSHSEQHVEKRRYYAKPSRDRDEDDKPKRIVKKHVEEKPEPKVVRQSKPEPKPEPEIKYADAQGRMFDLKSKVWFDGKDTCYSGKNNFSFQGGHWYYGGAQWNQQNGAWSTKSSTPPAVADCMVVPRIASKIEQGNTKVALVNTKPEGKIETSSVTPPPAGEIKSVGKQITTSAEVPPAGKIVSAEVAKEAPKAEAKETTVKFDAKTVAKVEKQVKSAVTDLCKKYFPSVGAMLDVPCGE